MSKSDNLKRTVPSLFNPSGNRNWNILLNAFGKALDNAVQGVQDAKEQLFVETADGRFLEARGDNYGVRKFTEIAFNDDKFRELIKILSFRPKQVLQTIKDFLFLFFGDSPLVKVQEINPNELVIQIPATVPTIINRLIGAHHFHAEGARLIKIDVATNRVTVNFESNETDTDLVNDMSHASDWIGSADVTGIVAYSDVPEAAAEQSIKFNKSLTTSTFGSISWTPNGVVDLSNYAFAAHWLKVPDLTNITKVSLILGSGNVGDSSTYDFDVAFLVANKWNYLNYDLTSPTSTTGDGVGFSNINSLTLKITFALAANTLSDIQVDDIAGIRTSIIYPANFFVGTTLRQNRKIFNVVASTAGHTNVVLTTTNGVDSVLPDLNKEDKAFALWTNWPGSFLYDPNGGMTVYFSAQTVLDQTIAAGSFGTLTDFVDSSEIPNAAGFLVFDFGTDNQEGPVPYLSRPDNAHLSIDPGYQFTKTHTPGSITILANDSGYEPMDSGFDYGVFNTSIQLPSDVAQAQLQKIIAAGIVIRFIIVDPHFSPLFS